MFGDGKVPWWFSRVYAVLILIGIVEAFESLSYEVFVPTHFGLLTEATSR